MNTQLLIIGAGPGGYTAAFRAADLGLNVTLVDRQETPGGICLYRGCIPSKSLLEVAKTLSRSKDAAETGVDFGTPNIDIDKIRSWKNSVISKLSTGLQSLTKQKKINFIQGKSSFVNSNTARVEKISDSQEEIQFEHAILATGSEPISLPFAPQSPRILNSSSALHIKDIPQKLLVVGGGYIGLELGTVYAALGSQVSVVEMTPSLLPGVDADLTRVLERSIKNVFSDIKVNTKVTGIKDTGHGLVAAFEDKDGNTVSVEYDKILVAIGRKPVTRKLGLENTKIETDDAGFVKVNAHRQTTDPAIYAVGDIAGNPMLAHKASSEAIVAAGAIAGGKNVFEPKAIPAVVFTDPEVAWCGLTKSDAEEQNRNVKIIKLPWSASGRAATMNRTDGMTKLIIDPQTKQILGAAVVGAEAGELISECVLAIEMGATVDDLKLSIHPHPTLSETIMDAAANFFKG